MPKLINADELVARYEQIIYDYAEAGLYPHNFGIKDAINIVEEMPEIEIMSRKKPNVESVVECYDTYTCPSCDSYIGKNQKICNYCGQRILWE